MPKLDVNGVGLAYDDAGRPDGVPLVFIHGWTANRHRWDDQLGHFAGRELGYLGLFGLVVVGQGGKRKRNVLEKTDDL